MTQAFRDSTDGRPDTLPGCDDLNLRLLDKVVGRLHAGQLAFEVVSLLRDALSTDAKL